MDDELTVWCVAYRDPNYGPWRLIGHEDVTDGVFTPDVFSHKAMAGARAAAMAESWPEIHYMALPLRGDLIQGESG